jgi:hypothetical protein
MIKVLHLINGEVLIGKIKNDAERSAIYIIEQPFMMDIIDDSDEGSGIRMDYLLAFSKDNCVHIKKNVVLYNYNPSNRLEEYYSRLVEFTAKRENDIMLKETLEGMEEMDRKMKSLLSQKLVGKSTLN